MPFDPVTYKAPAVDALGETFLKAAELIKQHGHYKGYYCLNDKGPDFGPVCLWGAINLAHTGFPHDAIPIGLSVVIQNRLGFGRGELATWNDMPERTASEVIARLRAAAVPHA